MNLVPLEYVIGFNIAVAVLLIALVFLTALKRRWSIFNIYLAHVTFVLGAAGLMEVLLNFDLPVRALSMIRVADIFFIANLPAFMVLAVLTFTGSPRQSAWMRAVIYMISILFSTSMATITALFYAPGQAGDELFMVWAVMLYMSFIGCFYLLIKYRRKDRAQSKTMILMTVFISANLVGFIVIEAFYFKGSSAYQLMSSIQMYVNALVLGYIVLYVEPVEKALFIYEKLKKNFDDMMKHVGEGIALLDDKGRVISCNASLVDLLGRPEQDIVGRPIERFVPTGMADIIRSVIYRTRSGSVVKDIRHPVLNRSKAGHDGDSGNVLTVLSTFSPVNRPNGVLEGILMMTKDITPVINLEVEKVLRSRAEAQNQVQKILTRIVPSLFNVGGPQARNVYLNLVLNEIEKAFTRDMPEDYRRKMDTPEGIGSDDIADYLCQVMNGLGGLFYWEPMVEHGAGEGPEGQVVGKMFYNVECPWGTEAKDNPLLCNLCRGIFTRISQYHREDANTVVVKTMGNGNDRCVVKVRMGANDEARPVSVMKGEAGEVRTSG